MSSKIVVKRDRGFADFARKYKIVLNGEEVGSIKNGGLFELELLPGIYTMKLKVDWCGSHPLTFEIIENTVKNFECGSNLRGKKIFSASKIMYKSPNEWIWLKAT